jgi:hypothetical protein
MVFAQQMVVGAAVEVEVGVRGAMHAQLLQHAQRGDVLALRPCVNLLIV